MRRNSCRFILFLLAMAVQVIAPVMGGMAFAHERVHGEAISSLCRNAAGDIGEAPAPPPRHDSCALCQFLCDGATPVIVRDYASDPAGAVWFDLAWGARDFVLPTTRIDHTRRARAPPFFS